MKRSTLSMLFLLALLASLLHAVEPQQKPVPKGGKMILDSQELVGASMKPVGPQYAKIERVSVDGMEFDKALRVNVHERPVKYYHVQTKLMKVPAIKKGDVVLATFWARCTGGGTLETAVGNVGVGLQEKETNDVIAKMIAEPPADWQQFFLPFQSNKDVPAGDAALTFSYGYMVQTIEIGGLQVINYGHDVALDDLPKTFMTYKGRDSEAPWRKEAEARIDKYRKADLQVTVVDGAGKPVPSADVHVEMTRHAFHFGAAVTGRSMVDKVNGPIILQKHAELFNQGVPISWMYWRDVTDSEARTHADALFDYFTKSGMYARGHALMYEREDLVPPHVKEMIAAGDVAKLRKTTDDYLREQVTRFKGRVNEWVLENESVDNRMIREPLGGDKVIADWAKLVKQVDPSARVMINENRLEGLKPDKTERLLAIVKTVLDNGGPIDTIGIQGHMQSNPVPPEILMKHFDQLASSGLRLAITEYDFLTEDEQLRADYTRDFYTTVFSHPSFDCITIWRFWDGKPTHNESVIYANDWSLRPSGQAYRDLVFKKWWTDARGQTDAAGTYATRGFLGDYKVTVTNGGKTAMVTTQLKKDAPNVVRVTVQP